MPSLSQITANFFVSLINRLGVRPPPGEAFLLSNVVQPVTIVDTDVALNAVASTQTLGTPFTAGELVAPAANTVLADTGAQAAGTYVATIMIGMSADANGNLDFRIQRRDGANAANIWTQIGGQGFSTAINPNFYLYTLRLTLDVNERLRILTKNNVAALEVVQASIWLNLV